VPVDGASAAADVAMTAEYSCAALQDGSVICWVDHAEPTVVPGVTDAVNVAVAMPDATGQAIGCAVRADSTIACWSTGDAVPVPGLTGVVQISGSLWTDNLAARTKDGHVSLLHSDASAAITTQLLDIQDAVDVSAGYRGICAVHAGDGSIECWDSSGVGSTFPLPW
jgi:hypothetical protein